MYWWNLKRQFLKMTTLKIHDFLQNVHLKQGVGMSRALKAWLFTNFSKVREARYRCHFAALVINVQTIRNPNGFAKGEVSKKCNGEVLNWVNTKTSLCPSFRVTIMDSQQLQINWTSFVTFLWSQPDFFQDYRVKPVNSDISTPCRIQYYSILVYLTKTCTTSSH